MKEKNLYITKGTWNPNNSNCISNKTTSKTKRMFGKEMIFELNRPLQLLNNAKTTNLTATFIGSASNNKYVYDSHIGIVIKIEALNTNHSPFIEAEYKIQQFNPIGITPIANLTPDNTNTKIWNLNNTMSIDCKSCMQLYKPVVTDSFLEQLLSSEKNKQQKTKTFATFFVVLYVNLIFQALSNLLSNSVLPTDWSLNNISFCEKGVVTIDFERFHIITQEMNKHEQTKKLKICFRHFFKQILNFCQTSNFHYQEMLKIITTLKKWNDDMCYNYEYGTLHETWQAPMFTSTFIHLVAETFQITSFLETTPIDIPWPHITKQYTIPNIYFFT